MRVSNDPLALLATGESRGKEESGKTESAVLVIVTCPSVLANSEEKKISLALARSAPGFGACRPTPGSYCTS